MEIHPDLRVRIGSLELKNPVLTASGTFGYGREFSPLMDLNRLGGIVVKGVSLSPREGNPPLAVEDAGADALTLINTLTGMAVDIEKRVPRLANLSGGLSGPAIRPVALFMVRQVVKAVRIPVIGVGGIMDHRDALEFLIAGARAIQVGTANFVQPQASVNIIEGLRDFCRSHGISGIEEIIGTLREG
ncbi:MAG: nitronate monooxygenase [Deltaproteobacteria bacterium]|nr:nitronate monooxygenase [Deltaproteobacteria bacterium]